MKTLILVLALASLAFSQTAPTVPASTQPAPASTVQAANLPDFAIGEGVGWTPGAAYPLQSLTTFGWRPWAALPIFSWTTIATPIAPAPTGGTPPPSSVRTGAFYVAAQTGPVLLGLLGDLGTQTTTSTSVLSYSAGPAVAVRIRKSNWYVMGAYRASGGSGTQTSYSPEIQAYYTFGGQAK